MNPASSITLASFVFSEIQQFLWPEHLARLAKTSKEMQILAIPMLVPLRQNKQAMHDLLLRLFFNLKNTHLRGPVSVAMYDQLLRRFNLRNLRGPEGVADASYYSGLLDAYFTSDHSKIPPQNIISRVVDVLLYKKELSNTATVKDYLMPAMQTAEGRRRVLRVIEEKRGPLRRSIEDRNAMHADERRRQLQQTLMHAWSQAHKLHHELLQLHLTFEATLPQPLTPHAAAIAAEQTARNHRALEEQ